MFKFQLIFTSKDSRKTVFFLDLTYPLHNKNTPFHRSTKKTPAKIPISTKLPHNKHIPLPALNAPLIQCAPPAAQRRNPTPASKSTLTAHPAEPHPGIQTHAQPPKRRNHAQTQNTYKPPYPLPPLCEIYTQLQNLFKYCFILLLLVGFPRFVSQLDFNPDFLREKVENPLVTGHTKNNNRYE